MLYQGARMQKYGTLKVLLVISIFLTSCSKAPDRKSPNNEIVHTAHLPSGWYTQDSQALTQELNHYLSFAHNHFPLNTNPDKVRAIIAPHAGYYYSGLCAATAYQSLIDSETFDQVTFKKNTQISRVIVLAPSHSIFFNGVALPDYNVYKTVLGDIRIDDKTVKKLVKTRGFHVYGAIYGKEHSLEMQLPMLQMTVDNFTLIPLIVGHMTMADIASVTQALKKIIDDTTLIVVSSDFTHYGRDYDYDVFSHDILNHIRMLDSLTVQAISKQSFQEFTTVLDRTRDTVCGQEPIKILLSLLEQGGLGNISSNVTCYYTSSQLKNARAQRDIFRNTGQFLQGAQGGNAFKSLLLAPIPDAEVGSSVSYVGMVFSSQEQGSQGDLQFTEYEKQTLLSLARQTLSRSLHKNGAGKDNEMYPMLSQALMQSSGAFVTLMKNGELRGCIGQLQTAEPLYKTVQDMTLAAAFNDSRFSPVVLQELDNLVIEISVLSKPIPVKDYPQIQLGKHGIILSKHNTEGKVIASAVFLAHVSEQFGWTLEQTLEQLSLKARLGKDSWKQGCTFEIFEETVFKESEK